MTNTLAAPADLTDFPGAPFTDAITDAAVGMVRREAGWHIAPAVTETLTVDSHGGWWLILPTMHLSAVTAVRDVSGDTPVVLTGWKVRRSGMLKRAAGWPLDAEIEVDVTHGHPTTPDELYAAVADRAQQTRQAGGNVRLGSLSIGAPSSAPSAADEIVARYRIPLGP